MASELEMREAEDAIDRLRDQLAAKDAEIAALKQALAAKDAALDKSRDVIRNALANKRLEGPLYSHANTAIHMISEATQNGRAGE